MKIQWIDERALRVGVDKCPCQGQGGPHAEGENGHQGANDGNEGRE